MARTISFDKERVVVSGDGKDRCCSEAGFEIKESSLFLLAPGPFSFASKIIERAGDVAEVTDKLAVEVKKS